MNDIEQIYTNCLAQGAYFIVSKGEAAVIDPLRDTTPYLERAQKLGVTIKYIFETHFHADFVSGHLDLAKETGAKIIYGPGAKTDYDIYNAKDGEIFLLGELKIKALHTPGHTPESTCYLLVDDKEEDHAIFTGDTLFIGDVGRPDLAQASTGLTQDILAGWLYDSLRNKIMTLDDSVIIYPAHGQGSACGKNMSSETWSTLGEQKKTNYALKAEMTQEEFIQEVTNGLQAPPNYFALNAKLNKSGYESYSDVFARGNTSIDIEEFKDLAKDPKVLILDVRPKEEFIKGFIPKSWFIGLDGSFAPWVGTLVKELDQKILLVAPEGREEEALMRLSRVGYDGTIGYLKGGFDNWKDSGEELNTINTISFDEFESLNNLYPDLKIVDVRKNGEWETSHIRSAEHLALDFIHNTVSSFDKDSLYYIHCRSGYRSTVAASILYAHGINNFVNVHCSFDQIKNGEFFLEGSCPSLINV